jgi:uncharacterized coiled-coil protein SlyX
LAWLQVLSATYLYGKPDGLSANAQKLIAVNQEVAELRLELQQKDAQMIEMTARLEALGQRV